MFYLLLMELSLLLPSAFALNAVTAKHIRKSVDDFLPNCDIIVHDLLSLTENALFNSNLGERAKTLITSGGLAASLV